MWSALEANIGFKIPVAHPVIAWLVIHSANILTWLTKGKDGRTPYHRVRGRPFSGKQLFFGEVCRYKCRSREPLHGRERWSQAMYLGRERQHGQHVLYDVASAKIAHARTVLRLPNAQKWCKDSLAAVRVTLYDIHEPKEPKVIFKDEVEKTQDNVELKPRVARRVYIKAADILRFGYTDGCPKCMHEYRYGAGRTTVPHSEACRQRIMRKLAENEAGQTSIANASARMDRAVAEFGEAHMQDLEHRQHAPQGEDIAEVGMRGQVDIEDVSNPFRIDEHLDSTARRAEAASFSSAPAVSVDFHQQYDAQEVAETPVAGVDESLDDSAGMGLGVTETARRCNVEVASEVDAGMGTGRGKVIDGSIASRVELTGIVGRGGSDREDQHRKQIMGVGRIVEVDAYCDAEARSETPAASRAAPATEPLPSDPDAVDYGRGDGPCQLTRPGAEPGVRNDAQSSDKLIHDPSGGIEGLSALLDLDFRHSSSMVRSRFSVLCGSSGEIRRAM